MFEVFKRLTKFNNEAPWFLKINGDNTGENRELIFFDNCYILIVLGSRFIYGEKVYVISSNYNQK
ncbi:MAG: hypothetical protein GY817_08535 [bacterium]|nr:hypothetical protein [bacterium]